jgi:eukaryotic-like serine/threonine-protein kinase
MDQEELVHAVFMRALDLSEGQRSTFVAAACRDDRLAAGLVQQLLSLHEQLSGMDGSLDLERAIGIRIGPYEIVRLLGCGAMGCVYLARRADGLFHKEVAIKLMGVPGRAADDLRFRFESERRILAGLRHPGIATLLDAGQMQDGRLYFIMEYIDGDSLTAYCRLHALGIRERIQLFLKVCEAVAYAHRNLVVHRDLKPGNIIVADDGEPKLLDFGIAKIVTRAAFDSEPTDPALRRATPAYASPEQLQGRPPHTSMDVYALGVITYELLTGVVRLQPAAQREVPTATSMGEPAPPSGRSASERSDAHPTVLDLDPDLGAIVARALAADWQTRYPSVDDLIADLRAWLTGRPVAARRGGPTYRALKWARRNRHLAGLGAVTCGAILVATWLSVAAYRTERDARRNGVRQLQAAAVLANDVLTIETALAQLAGSTAARRVVVSSLTRYLAAIDIAESGTLAVQTARAHRRLGDVEGNPNVPNLGNIDAARAHYASALKILEPLQRTAAPDLGQALAETYASIAEVDLQEGRLEEAERLAMRALAAAAPLASEGADRASSLKLIGGLHRTLGDVRLARQDAKAALLDYERAGAADDRLRVHPEGQADYSRLNALTLIRLGDAHAALGAYQQARGAYDAAVGALEQLSQDATRQSALRRDAALGFGRLARLIAPQDLPAATTLAGRAVSMLETVSKADPADARARRDLMIAFLQYGELSLTVDRDASHRAFRSARDLARKAYAAAPTDLGRSRDLREVEARLANVSPIEMTLEREEDASPVDSDGRPVGAGERLRVRASRVPVGWSPYLLSFGAQGGAQLLAAPSAGPAWSMAATGPGAAQTLIVIAVPQPLDAPERTRILAGVESVRAPRIIDFDAHVIWTDREERVSSTVSMRGARDLRWVREVREELSHLQSVRYSGRTFPVALPPP